MINIKGIALMNDGNAVRMAITYDEIDKVGKIIKANVRINRIITDSTILSAVTELNEYAQYIVDNQE